MDKITEEVARREVGKWLDYKKVKDKKRENLEAQIDVIVDNIVDGTLVLDSDHKFTHTLSFPLTNAKGEVTLKSVTYKPRLTVKEINSKMSGIKASDADGRVIGYIAALTDQPSAIIANMDTEDNSLAQAFATFFL